MWFITIKTVFGICYCQYLRKVIEKNSLRFLEAFIITVVSFTLLNLATDRPTDRHMDKQTDRHTNLVTEALEKYGNNCELMIMK